MEIKKNKTFFFLLVIVLLGFTLRLYQLDQESIWIDEILTIDHAQQQNISGVVQRVSLREGAPPGHYVLLHYWIQLFGNSSFSVRFPSVIFGTVSILIIFLVVRTIATDKIAIISSLFLATSMLQILYSQEARLYAMFTFLSLLSTYFYITTFIKDGNKKEKKHLVGYIITTIAAVYTNYMALFLIAGQTVIFLWYNKNYLSNKKTLKFFLILLGVGLISLPLIPILNKQFSAIGSGASLTFISFGVPPIIANFGLLMFALPLLIISIIMSLFLVLSKNKIITKTKERIENKTINYNFLILMTIFFSVIYIYLSLKPLSIVGIPLFRVPITHSYFLIRHSFFIVPLFYVFIAYYLIIKTPKHIYITVITILLMTNAVSLYFYYSEPTKQQWQEVVSFIEQNSNTSPLILLDRGGSTNTYLLHYYATSNPTIIKLTKSPRGQPLWKIKPEQLFSKLQNETEFWLILAGNGETNDYYEKLLNKKYMQTEVKEFYLITVYQYKNAFSTQDKLK